MKLTDKQIAEEYRKTLAAWLNAARSLPSLFKKD